jgi:hypothetical protein
MNGTGITSMPVLTDTSSSPADGIGLVLNFQKPSLSGYSETSLGKVN